MRAVRLVLSLLAALALLAPGALAASARGELEASGVAFPDGAALDSAGLDLLSTAGSLPALALEATEVSVHRLGSTEVRVGDVYRLSNEQIDERADHASATLSLVAGEGDHIVALRALGPSTAELSGATMRGLSGANLASVEARDTCEAPNDELTGYHDPYCLDVRGVHEILGAATATVGGEITLLLYGPTLRVTSGGEITEYASGQRAASDGVQREDAWVVVRAASATGTFAADALSLYSAAPTLRAPAVELADADGLMRVGARDYRAANDRVVATGALVLSPGPVAPAESTDYSVEPVYAASVTTRIAGDVDSINLNSASAFLDTPAEKAGFAAVLALLVGAAVYAWQHLTFLAAALYTRLNKPDILDNDVRNRIYDIIRENPGISAREVHRRSEQSWGTVVYHLRQLERHHLVVSRSLGRTRNYYENHGKYRGMEVQLACLQSDRARVLARAIATQPGITQEHLAAASGFPQPTTSYYVRKLKLAGLVEEQREGRYVKYVPHVDLPRFIAMSEKAPAIDVSPSSGVNA